MNRFYLTVLLCAYTSIKSMEPIPSAPISTPKQLGHKQITPTKCLGSKSVVSSFGSILGSKNSAFKNCVNSPKRERTDSMIVQTNNSDFDDSESDTENTAKSKLPHKYYAQSKSTSPESQSEEI